MQKSLSDLEYAAKKKLTRRDRFLAEIDSVTPWGKLHKLIEPFYPKVEGAGRPPIGLARMLRMYVAQQCFGLSDEGIEDAIYDSQAIRAFVGIDLGRAAGLAVPAYMASLSYFDAFRTGRSSSNLIQAQRDYFGAHTYELVGKEGVFHTQWTPELEDAANKKDVQVDEHGPAKEPVQPNN